MPTGTSEPMYAHKDQNGMFCHFGVDPDFPRVQGDGPIYKVLVSADPNGSYWGWWDWGQRHFTRVEVKGNSEAGEILEVTVDGCSVTDVVSVVLVAAGEARREIHRVTVDEFPGEIISE